MKRLFDMDNPLMQALGILADLMVLNLLTIVCSLPVLTAGAALTALNATAHKADIRGIGAIESLGGDGNGVQILLGQHQAGQKVVIPVV